MSGTLPSGKRTLPWSRTQRAPRVLPIPEQRLVARWADLLRRAEKSGTLQVAEPEPGVVMFAWYYDKYGLHELGEDATNPDALLAYQPKLRMREQAADGARKEKMKKLASDYFLRYRMYRLEAGFEHRGDHPRNFSVWDLPVELKKWIYFEVVKGYLYVDRQRLIKRLYDRLDKEKFVSRTPVQKAQQTNRIKVVPPGLAPAAVNITRALQEVGWEGFGFEEAVELEIEAARGGQLPPIRSNLVELRRAIEGDEFVENEGLWENHGPPTLRLPYFELIRLAASEGKRQVDDRVGAVLFAYPLKEGSARERRTCFYDAIAYVRANHAKQLRGRFYQQAPSRTPPEDLYITHVVNEWVDDEAALELVESAKAYTVQWVDSRALAKRVLQGLSEASILTSTGPRTAELRQRVLLLQGDTRRPFELSYGAQLIARFGYDFDQAVDLTVIKAYLKIEGA